MEHPLALQLRNLQTLLEISVDKNSTVVFPAPLMSTIQELGTFLARETEHAASVNGSGTESAGRCGCRPARTNRVHARVQIVDEHPGRAFSAARRTAGWPPRRRRVPIRLCPRVSSDDPASSGSWLDMDGPGLDDRTGTR